MIGTFWDIVMIGCDPEEICVRSPFDIIPAVIIFSYFLRVN